MFFSKPASSSGLSVSLGWSESSITAVPSSKPFPTAIVDTYTTDDHTREQKRCKALGAGFECHTRERAVWPLHISLLALWHDCDLI